MQTNITGNNDLTHLYKRIPKLKGDLHRSFLMQIRAASQIWRRLLYFSWEQSVFENWTQSLQQLAEKYSSIDKSGFDVSLVSVIKLAASSLEKNIPLSDKQRREITALLDSLEKNIAHGLVVDEDKDIPNYDTTASQKIIVVIDDDPMIIEFLRLHLEHSGYSIKGFQVPDEALEYIADSHPSVVIVDIMFPGDESGGIQIVKNIRKVSEENIPVMLLSAREDFSIRMQAVKAGGDAFITKPVDVSRLLDRLQDLTDDHAQYNERVLMIMPDSPLRKRYTGLLSHEGISVHFIDKPQETIAELVEYQPDLVVISEEIEQYEGIQVARMIYQQDDFSGLPIMFVADEVTQEKREIVYRLDADIIEADSSDSIILSFMESRISQYRKHITYSEYSAMKSVSNSIMNRHEFMYELSLAIELAGKQGNSSALLFVEINNLNFLRQRYGMDCGDLVMRDIGGIITNTVKNQAVVSRYSDTVFSVLISNSVSRNEIHLEEVIYNKIRLYRTSLNNETVSLDPVVGGIVLDNNSKNTSEVIQGILHVCEIAHGKEPNKIHFSEMSSSDLSDNPDAQQCLQDIRYALANEGFKLVYQPIMDLREEGIDKYELLLRLFNKEGQAISPAKFFPVARKNNLMGAIDRWVIENALKSLSMIPKGMDHPLLFMKISSLSLGDGTLVSWLGERISHYKLEDLSLVFELNERAITRCPEQAVSFKQRVEAKGCKLALEHFGSLKDSLQLLEQIRPHYVKIDGSMIRGLGYNRINQSKVTSITDKAKHYDCQTVAEFVEEATSLPVLWKCGVDFVQGHFLQEPTESMAHDFSIEEISQAV